MLRQCAWCLVMLGESEPLHDTSVTHGICQKCAKKMKEEIQAMEQKQSMRKA